MRVAYIGAFRIRLISLDDFFVEFYFLLIYILYNGRIIKYRICKSKQFETLESEHDASRKTPENSSSKPKKIDLFGDIIHAHTPKIENLVSTIDGAFAHDISRRLFIIICAVCLVRRAQEHRPRVVTARRDSRRRDRCATSFTEIVCVSDVVFCV